MHPIDDKPTPTSRRHAGLFALCAALGFGATIAFQWRVPTAPPAAPATTQASASSTVAPLAAKSPPRSAQVQFEPNRGQADAATRFIARDAGFTVEVLADGMRLRERAGSASAEPHEATMRFLGAHRGGTFEPRACVDGVSHYLVGADASRWLRNVPRYQQLRYDSLYDGIDLVYYGR